MREAAGFGATIGGSPPRLLVSAVVGLAVFAGGWATAMAPTDPVPLGVVLVAGAAVLGVRYVELAAAALAFVIAGNLSSVATNVHGLPSPSIALALAIVVAIVVRSDRSSFLPPPRLVLALAGYVLVVLASTLWAGEPDRSFAVTDTLIRDVLLGVLVAVVVHRTGSLRLTLWAIAAATVLLGAVSTVQYLTGSPDQTYFGLGGAVLANIVEGTDDWRVVGPFGDPNYYAQALGVGAAILLERAVHEVRPVLRLAASAGAAICAFAVFTTFSRGGAVTLVAVLLALALVRRPRASTIAILVMGLAVVIVALPNDFRERLLEVADVGGGAESGGPEDVAIRGRLSEILAGGAMFRDEPLLGVGAGNYPALYTDYAQAYQLDLRRSERAPHSLYVEIAAETGTVGLVAFGALLASAAVAARRCPVRTRRGDAAAGAERGLVCGLGLALFAFLCSSIFLHAAHARVFWLLLALLLALPEADRARPGPSDVVTSRHLDAPAPTG